MTKPATSPTTAQFLGALLKSARDIMRKDKGMDGDLLMLHYSVPTRLTERN